MKVQSVILPKLSLRPHGQPSFQTLKSAFLAVMNLYQETMFLQWIFRCAGVIKTVKCVTLNYNSVNCAARFQYM